MVLRSDRVRPPTAGRNDVAHPELGPVPADNLCADRIGEVVRPRAVVTSVTCHQWLTTGASARRILPTTCVHMCSVA